MASNIDPISRDVFQSQVHGVADEMSVALKQASFSSIIWDMYDYSCGLFLPDGDIDQPHLSSNAFSQRSKGSMMCESAEIT